MKTSKHLMIRFYQQLAGILYGVAVSDGKVREQELEVIKDILKSEWILPGDGPEILGADAVYQIENAIDWMVKMDWDVEKAIRDFEDFKKEHEEIFTTEVTHMILKTLNTIASAFAGKNKSELVFISRLYLILKGSSASGK